MYTIQSPHLHQYDLCTSAGGVTMIIVPLENTNTQMKGTTLVYQSMPAFLAAVGTQSVYNNINISHPLIGTQIFV